MGKEMIAGRQPFKGETPTDVILAIVTQDPAPLAEFAPEVPDELQRIVSRALSKKREARYQSARELLVDLSDLRMKLDSGTRVRGFHVPMAADGEVTRTEDLGVATVAADTTRTLSFKSLFVQIRRRQRTAFLAIAALVIAATALWLNFNREPALTERDTVLLAEFENRTGEEVFDGTLRQALAVQLEQTPFLNLLSDERVREMLGYLGRPRDERLTRSLAREICQRQGVKAMIFGSIARLDKNYSIILEAFNGQTGETIASALAEAEGKERVLRALGSATTQLRQRLGESLASIQKFDAPLEQATTSSLDAFKAWSRGVALSRSGKGMEAIPFYKHARELDPGFAKADVSLSMAYSNMGRLDLAADFAESAYRLRERLTEREKFDVTSNYHALTTGDLLKAIEETELWRQTYPRDYGPRARLASLYRLVGNIEKALEAARESNQLNPRAYVPYVDMGTALLKLNRFDEARSVIEQALSQRLATTTSRRDLYQLASITGDIETADGQVESVAGKPEEYWAIHWQAQAASFAGQMRNALSLYDRAAKLIEKRNEERAARFAEEARLRSAVCGECKGIATGVSFDSANSRLSLQSYPPAIVNRALAQALCGETAKAQSLAEQVARANPQSTLANLIWLPVIRAAIELRRDRPAAAIESLQAVRSYEAATLFLANYYRGRAYLKLGKGAEASGEFRKIIDNRGLDARSPLYPLAHLGLARASKLTGNSAGSRKSFQVFLELWKDADPDLPVLREAVDEFEGQR